MSISVFLDSGAYSAKSQGVHIDIQEYISFVQSNSKVLDVYANLDVIGDPEATLQNQKIMEKAGLKPLPVFHVGEDEQKYLKHYVDNYDYVAIGGMVKYGRLTEFLDRVFSKYICDDKGMPKVKVHGFGMTNLKLMLRYPWYSVDSTSWIMTGSLGSIMIPRKKGNQYIYDKGSWKIQVSGRKGKDAWHFNNLPPVSRAIVEEFIQSKGFIMGESLFKKVDASYQPKDGEKWAGAADVDGKRELEVIVTSGLCNDYKLRDKLNIDYFVCLQEQIPKWPWKFNKPRTGFGL